MGGGISAKNVEEAMHYCIQVGLWDKRLLEEWGIITSIDIQQNYLIAAKKARHKVKIISEYWLLAEKPSSGSLLSGDGQREYVRLAAGRSHQGKTNQT